MLLLLTYTMAHLEPQKEKYNETEYNRTRFHS